MPPKNLVRMYPIHRLRTGAETIVKGGWVWFIFHNYASRGTAMENLRRRKILADRSARARKRGQYGPEAAKDNQRAYWIVAKTPKGWSLCQRVGPGNSIRASELKRWL